jgi:DHA1 family bicyclomycin/chloramphenicol resistance-like MFS transporter
MYVPSLPGIGAAFGATTQEVQLTISSYLVGFALGQIVYGPVSDRYGRKPVLIGALVVYCLASLVCALSSSIGMLIGARALQALGGCGGIVLARAIVRDLYAGARAGRELSLISSVMALAPVVAPIAGGLLQSGFGWRSVFVMLLVLGLVGIAVIWLLLPETLTRRAGPLTFSSMLASYCVMVRHPAYLAYMALATTSYAGLFAWISGASFVLQDLYRLSPFTFGIAFALGSVGFMAGSALAARLVAPLGIDRTIGIGCLFCTAGGLAMVVSIALGLPWWLSLVLPMAIYLAGMGMVLPQSIAGAMMPFPERAGAASALLGFVQQSGAALCGVAVGHWLGSSAWPLASAVALMGSASLLLWIGTRTLRAQVAAHP